MSDSRGETSAFQRGRSFAETVVRGISQENVTFMAGSIAYQAFISLISLLVLVFFLVSVVGDEGLASQVTQTTEGFLPDAGNELLEDAIAGSVATTGGTIIGRAVLEAENERLRSENEELHRRVERERHPAWRRPLERLFQRESRVNLGVVRR
ncbi:YhjD/YihY/BrkB family envelope integrity protein [Halostagnicola sp. A-GB9-2]|uniref:YhjD/YihY/BrkB family envelope integrity protein n=1 Tax=Halostagnicola sp. A-GB9-2 TaxID=3048066 RepID=UPI0031F31176